MTTIIRMDSLRETLAHMPEGAMVESRKYKMFGEWTPWRAVSPAQALRRLSVRTSDGYCPYEVRVS